MDTRKPIFLEEQIYGTTTELLPFLSFKEKSLLSRINKANHLFFKNDMLLAQLLDHVLRADEAKVKKIIDKNPDLLLRSGLAIDHSGRKVYGTPFQIALGTQDSDICKLFESYFYMLPNGAELALQQLKDKTLSWDFLPFDYKPLIDAISNDQLTNNQITEETQEELSKFRSHLNNQPIQANHYGSDIYHFNMTSKCFSNMRNIWNQKQLTFFLINVIGYCQRFYSAVGIQKLCSGFGISKTPPSSYQRKSYLQTNNGFLGFLSRNPYFPLDTTPSMRLGFDYALGGEGDALFMMHSTSDPRSLEYMRVYYGFLVIKKHWFDEVKQLANRLKNPSEYKSTCVIS
ncbi:MAG: hypothetical protein WAW86_07230 [Gammaproteobacteria bacterium]